MDIDIHFPIAIDIGLYICVSIDIDMVIGIDYH